MKRVALIVFILLSLSRVLSADNVDTDDFELVLCMTETIMMDKDSMFVLIKEHEVAIDSVVISHEQIMKAHKELEEMKRKRDILERKLKLLRIILDRKKVNYENRSNIQDK